MRWLISLAAALFSSLAATPAGAFSAEQRSQLEADAKSHPHSHASQRTIDLAQKLGQAGDVEALDFVLDLRHAAILSVWAGAFLEAHRGKLSPAIEQRIVRVYDDERLVWALMNAIDRYESPALADRLIDDTLELAKARAERARRCRIGIRERAPEDPRFRGLGGGAHTPLIGAGGRPYPQVICPAELQQMPAFSRREAAVRLVGNTRLPGVIERVAPQIRALAMTPPADAAVRESPQFSPYAGTIGSLVSVASLAVATGYRAAAPDFVAALAPVQGTFAADFSASWPVLQALAELDYREGAQTIARFAEARAVAPMPSDAHPTLGEIVILLGGVLPDAQIDIAALRERVMPKVRPADAAAVELAFRTAEKWSQGLLQPGPADLVAWSGSGNLRVVRYLLSRGVPVNVRDAQGGTPLIASLRQRRFDVQKILLQAGASIDFTDAQGAKPFYHALQSFYRFDEDYRVLDDFLAKGVNVNAIVNGGTPLHVAAARDVELTRYLIKRNAAVNATVKGGQTPLHVAVFSRKVDIAEALIAAGANVNAEMDDRVGTGLRPLQAARDAKDDRMIALLERHGASVSYTYLAKRKAAEAAASALGPFIGH